MNTMGQDVRYALRQLRRSPGFAVAAVLTLALGIGATTAMFSVVREVLLAPLPYRDAGRLVGVDFAFAGEKPSAEQAGASADFIARHSRSFEAVGIADDGMSPVNLVTATGNAGAGHARQVQQLRVSAGFLPTLGIAPTMGRLFTVEEDTPGGPRAVILSEELWRSEFAADPGIVGRVIQVDGASVPVVGVLPGGAAADLQGASSTTEAAGLWQPMKLSAKDPGYEGDNYRMIARLRDGVTAEEAQAEVATLEKPFYAQSPAHLWWTAQGKLVRGFRVWPLKDAITSNVRSSLLLLLAAVTAVLLIACLNLAGLLVARTMARTREIAIRSALGASQAAVVRLVLAEIAVLAVAGGLLGTVLARDGAALFLAAAPLDVPRLHGAESWQMYALFALCLSCAVTLLAGLVPVAFALRKGLRSGMQEGGAQGQSPAVVRSGNVLILLQVGCALLLLSGASLLLNGFLRLRSVSPGVATTHVVCAQVSLKGSKYDSAEQTTQFNDRVLEQLGRLPGVVHAGAVNGLPLEHGVNLGGTLPERPDVRHMIELRPMTPEYLRTLEIPLLAGRTIAPSDTAHTPLVTVISEAAARGWWPDESALGHTVRVGNAQNFQVVGVAADTHAHSLMESPQYMVYVPVVQLNDGLTAIENGWSPTSFVLRLSGEYDLTAAVTEAIRNVDPDMPLAKMTTMQAVIDRTTAAPRFFSWLSSGFAVFALGITAIGLFGLLSYAVTQRTREIGVRMALGADRRDVLRLVVGRGMVVTAAGSVLGVAASALLPRLLDSVIADVVYSGSPTVTATTLQQEGVAIGTAVLVMLLISLGASLLPARRAAMIEPSHALRAE